MSGKHVAAFVLAGVVVIGAPAAVWGITVASSGVKGAGDTIIVNNSSVNRIKAQERFEDLYAGIVATDRKITAQEPNVLAGIPDGKTAGQTMAGLVSACLDLVSDYDADARKVTAADWRAFDLPQSIDIHNPATDCKA